jgi:prevent-host-death family protein
MHIILIYRKEHKMPIIRPSVDLRNKYNEISELCHENNEPVFITKNGRGDLAVMSVEAYETMTSRYSLYGKIEEGLAAVKAGRTNPLDEAMRDVRKAVFG